VTISDIILFAFSLLGLFLVPAALGRAAWTIPAGLAAVALYVLFAPASLHPHANPWVHALLSQGPWMMLALDLVCRGNISRLLDRAGAATTPDGPLRSLLALSLFRFMGLRFVFSAITGDLAPGFALEAATGELFAALGGLALWAFYRPRSRLYRGILIFWNTYALVASLALNFRILRADPYFPLSGAAASREVHHFFTSWPNALDAYFWIPLGIGVHAAIFYTLIKEGQRGNVSP
jgi:hypothetical protein